MSHARFRIPCKVPAIVDDHVHMNIPIVKDRYIRNIPIKDIEVTDTFVRIYGADVVDLFGASMLADLKISTVNITSPTHIIMPLKIEEAIQSFAYIIYTARNPMDITILNQVYHIRGGHSAVMCNMLHCKGFTITVRDCSTKSNPGVTIIKISE